MMMILSRYIKTFGSSSGPNSTLLSRLHLSRTGNTVLRELAILKTDMPPSFALPAALGTVIWSCCNGDLALYQFFLGLDFFHGE